MKRKLLALAIGCSLLAACGGSSNNADNTPDNNQDNAPENPQPETPDNTPVGTLNLALLATHTADEDFATSAAVLHPSSPVSLRLL